LRGRAVCTYDWKKLTAAASVVAALIAIPASILDLWQKLGFGDEQTEVKRDLTKQIDGSVTSFVTAVQRAERRGISQDDFNAAFQAWETKSAEIESQIRSDFGASIAEEWERYASYVTDFYALTGVSGSADRQRLASRLVAYFGGDDARALSDRSNADFDESWFALKGHVLDKRDDITERIRDA
jgi:hypothetical protein